MLLRVAKVSLPQEQFTFRAIDTCKAWRENIGTHTCWGGGNPCNLFKGIRYLCSCLCSLTCHDKSASQKAACPHAADEVIHRLKPYKCNCAMSYRSAPAPFFSARGSQPATD